MPNHHRSVPCVPSPRPRAAGSPCLKSPPQPAGHHARRRGVQFAKAVPQLLPALCAYAMLASAAQAQVDTEKRQLVQFGYNQSFQGAAPIAAYAFYHLNLPDWPRAGQVLRLSVAPVYVDGELAFREGIGQQTDVAVGLAGGGFADGHSEIRGGKFLREESFNGHGGEVSGSIYHLFNPGARIPLNGIVRAALHFSEYDRDSRTAPGFVLPSDTGSLRLRTGLRYGGSEPVLAPKMAMELSVWHETDIRFNSGNYGLAGDRRVEPQSHQFWARALMSYEVPDRGDYFAVNLTTGTSLNADRLSGYKLGGALPMSSEFPLSLPGYYFQELTARQFALLGGLYSVPLDAQKQWHLTGYAATAVVDYVAGMSQAGNWHSGVGGGIGYTSPNKVWEVVLGYAYGIDAMRTDGRGAHTIGLVAQFDIEARGAKHKNATPNPEPEKSRGLQQMFRGVFGD